jgi:hypothetical protein
LFQGKTWRDYAWRRFLRIFPLYTVVLLAMIAMEKLAFSDLWTHLLLQDGKRVFWTIAVEGEILYAAAAPRAGAFLGCAKGVVAAGDRQRYGNSDRRRTPRFGWKVVPTSQRPACSESRALSSWCRDCDRLSDICKMRASQSLGNGPRDHRDCGFARDPLASAIYL